MEKLTDKLFTNRYVEDTGHPHIEIANQPTVLPCIDFILLSL